MKTGPGHEIEPVCEPGTEKEAMREVLRWCLWGMPLLAVAIGVVLLVVQHAHFSEAGRRFLGAVVYSVVIGMPSAVLLNVVGFRFTERFPRLILLINIAVLVVMATVGCLVAGLVFQAIGFMSREYYWIEFRGSLPTCYVISLTVGLGISSFETMRHKLHYATLELRTQQMEQERANKLLAEAVRPAAMIADGYQASSRRVDCGLEEFVAHATFVGQAHARGRRRRAGYSRTGNPRKA